LERVQFPPGDRVRPSSPADASESGDGCADVRPHATPGRNARRGALRTGAGLMLAAGGVSQAVDAQPITVGVQRRDGWVLRADDR
jgi:hypothetical protein